MTGDPVAEARRRAAALAFWSQPVDPVPLGGGMTNLNFLVEHRGARFVVRIGADLPLHQVMRFNEAAAARAAAAAGIAPDLVHAEPGVLVSRFVEGRALTAADVRRPAMLARILPLIRRCHRVLPEHLAGPILAFWVFHVIRDYARTLRAGGSRWAPELAALLAAGRRLEALVGPGETVFGHNDLLAANLIDDGARLWLIDWDYAGFGSPLFDLANLASNSGLDEAAEDWLLEAYFGHAVTADLRRSFAAMKAASLLREAMWGMVQERHSSIAFDYAGYAAANLARFRLAWAALEQG